MSIQRTLQKYMDDWKTISSLDFCLITDENEVFVTTCSRSLPSEKSSVNSGKATLLSCKHQLLSL